MATQRAEPSSRQSRSPVTSVHSARSCSLRSGAELRPLRRTWTWLGADSDESVDLPDRDTATELVRACAQAAEKLGLPVGSKWAPDPLVVTPQPKLIKVINDTWPLPEDD